MLKINPELHSSTVPHRALRIGRAVLAHQSTMRPLANGYSELRVGPFNILHAPPEAYPNGPWHNVNIWQQGEGKVANIEWAEADGWAIVGTVSFRSGAWEQELLDLLGTVEFVPNGGPDSIH